MSRGLFFFFFLPVISRRLESVGEKKKKGFLVLFWSFPMLDFAPFINRTIAFLFAWSIPPSSRKLLDGLLFCFGASTGGIIAPSWWVFSLPLACPGLERRQEGTPGCWSVKLLKTGRKRFYLPSSSHVMSRWPWRLFFAQKLSWRLQPNKGSGSTNPGKVR